MQYIFRCILDVEEDVIRDISVSGKVTLEQLHELIRDAFGMKKGEMASFYKTDEDWEQGDEIPLFDMSDAGTKGEMRDHKISNIFTRKDDKIIFVKKSSWIYRVTKGSSRYEAENYPRCPQRPYP